MTSITTNASTTSGSISSAGIGSGLDVNGIVSSLMSVESRPLTLLQNKASTINTEISAVGQIQSLTATLGDKARALSSYALWNQTTSSSADTSVVTADTSSGTATAGDYAVSVQQLAQGQTVTSGTFSSTSATVGTGTITIQLGAYSGGTPPTAFTPKSGSSAITISVGTSDSSLAKIKDLINQSSTGITASVISDASGARLSLRSTASGESNGFKITTTETTDDGVAATGLSALDYDPVGSDAQLSLNQSATNAEATVNGISVESESNTLANIADGLSLTLLKVSSTPVDVTVSTDSAAQTTAINDFVSAYSGLNAYIHDQTKYDASTKTGGPLMGDPSIIGFQTQMRNIINTTSTTSTMYARLSDIGVSVQADGSLAVSSTKLQAAIAHPAELKKLFATYGTTDTTTGIMLRFSRLTDQALSGSGQVAGREAGLKAELTRNQNQQTDLQTHLDATQSRLTAQYQALDTTMSKMTALSTYVSQQMSALSK